MMYSARDIDTPPQSWFETKQEDKTVELILERNRLRFIIIAASIIGYLCLANFVIIPLMTQICVQEKCKIVYDNGTCNLEVIDSKLHDTTYMVKCPDLVPVNGEINCYLKNSLLEPILECVTGKTLTYYTILFFSIFIGVITYMIIKTYKKPIVNIRDQYVSI
jgi:hypothetical protein